MPEDVGLLPQDSDDKIKEWVYSKHPELIDSFEKEINKGIYDGAYFYALLPDDEEDTMIHYIALYYNENPESLLSYIEDMKSEYCL